MVFKGATNIFNALYSLAFLIFVTILPVLSIRILNKSKKKKKLDDKETIKNYGTLYSDLKVDSNWALYYWPVFMVRRVILSVVLVFFTKFPTFLLWVYFILSIL